MLHSYDPDNTQWKTVASSNNGVQVSERKRKTKRGQDTKKRKRRKSKKVGMKNKMWHSKIMQDLVVAVWYSSMVGKTLQF